MTTHEVYSYNDNGVLQLNFECKVCVYVRMNWMRSAGSMRYLLGIFFLFDGENTEERERECVCVK